MNSQLKRGTLEMCVLAIVDRKDCYGYELVNQISECMQITEGTIYPLLKRLKDQGNINSYIVESQEGPPRKYYTITPVGTAAKREQEQQWWQFVAGVGKITGAPPGVDVGLLSESVSQIFRKRDGENNE